jgi:hypothetical protein
MGWTPLDSIYVPGWRCCVSAVNRLLEMNWPGNRYQRIQPGPGFRPLEGHHPTSNYVLALVFATARIAALSVLVLAPKLHALGATYLATPIDQIGEYGCLEAHSRPHVLRGVELSGRHAPVAHELSRRHCARARALVSVKLFPEQE